MQGLSSKSYLLPSFIWILFAVNNIKGPDPESRGSSVTDSPTPRMFATELGTRSPQAVDGDLTIPPQLLQFHETQDQLSQSRVGETDVIGSGPVYDQDNTEPIPEQDNTEPAPEQDNNAQKVRSTSPSKSVRFAEKSAQSNKDIKQQTNIAKQQKARQGSGEDNKNKKKSKNSESCKSNDINEIHKKDDDDDNENKDNDKNRQTQSQSTPGSAVRDSAGTTKENKSGDTKSEGENKSSSQDQKRSSRNMRPRSHSPLQGQNCTKFRKSSASKPHKNKLQVQTVNHANATPTILGPESPSMSRSCSQSGNSTGKKGTEHDQYSFLAGTALDEYDYFRERSKVKFMIEGEEPEIETIFVEDENDIGLRPDKDITFEAIESELKSLRHRIQNKLFEQGSDKLELYDESDNDNEEAEDFTETDANNGEEMLFVEGRNPSRLEKESVIDTVQTDYTDLIEKYRKRCMDRSELYGAFSEKLITPRSQSSYANSNQLMHMQKLNTMNSDTSVDFDQKSKLLESSSVTHISDSGLGSLDNVSEVSKTASLKSGVPRLNLESCTSDLDLDSGSESSGQDKDDSDGTIVADKEFGADKNILEMVCDDLPPAEPKEDVNRKET